MSTQERGARTVPGRAGRDACDVAAILRGGELGPKRDVPDSDDRGSPATLISEVSVKIWGRDRRGNYKTKLARPQDYNTTCWCLDSVVVVVVIVAWATGRRVDRP